MRRLIPMIAIFALVGCDGAPGPQEPKETGPFASRIEVSPDSAVLNRQETQTFSATLIGQDGSTIFGPVTWMSSDTSIVSVDATGRARGVWAGNTQLTAKSGHIFKIVPVRVSLSGRWQLRTANGKAPPAMIDPFYVCTFGDAPAGPVTILPGYLEFRGDSVFWSVIIRHECGRSSFTMTTLAQRYRLERSTLTLTGAGVSAAGTITRDGMTLKLAEWLFPEILMTFSE